LKGKICRNWTLNPHPRLIPAIESGWVETIHSFGGALVHGGVTDTAFVNLNPVMPHKSSALTFRHLVFERRRWKREALVL
jgi:hypothetical protein